MSEFIHNFQWFLPSAANVAAYIRVVKGFATADRIEIEDVDYIDITPWIITDPARLLSEHSMTPFWVEDRRREKVHNRTTGLGIDTDAMLDEFEDILFGECTPHKPLPQWERNYNRVICSAFLELRKELHKAFRKFEAAACSTSWNLWEYQGLDDEEYSKATAEYVRICELSDIRCAFERDLFRLTHPGEIVDDFPF